MDLTYQYTVVLERPVQYVNNEKPQFFFKNYDAKKAVIEYVGKLETSLKVYKIFRVDTEGNSIEMTVGFEYGRLNLIKK
jgi:hypothetical protein